MEIKKNIINQHKYEIILSNEKNDAFSILYGGADLYWTMEDYYDENEFIVTEKDIPFYNQLTNLFKIIKKYDKHNLLLKENCFEWISDAYGLKEDAHKLTITKNNNTFIIKFIQNRNNFFCMKDICAISFCLSGSNHQEIANAFSLMFLEYKDDRKVKVKSLKK